MKKYRLKGQITVMAAMLIGVMALAAVMCVRSASLNMSMLQADEAVNLGLESVFSEYVRPLFEEYKVMGFYCDKKPGFIEKFTDYMSYNLNYEKDIPVYKSLLYKTGLVKADVTELYSITDRHGKIFAQQVTAYMKYKVPADVIKKWIGIAEQTTDTKSVSDTFDEYTEVVKYVSKIDELVIKVIQQIDIIRSNQISQQLKRLDTELILINAAYYSPETMGQIKDAGYKRILREIASQKKLVLNAMDNICDYIADIKEMSTILNGKIEEAESILESKKGHIPDELYEGYKSAYKELENYDTQISVINMTRLISAVESQRTVIETFNGAEELAKLQVTIGNLTSISAKLHTYQAELEKFDISLFTHNFQGEVQNPQKGYTFLNNIKKIMEDGILSLVVSDKDAVSGKTLTLSDVASDYMHIQKEEEKDAFSDINIEENILYNEYVVAHFGNYITSDDKAILEYKTEYVIGNSRNDKDNLIAVIKKLILIRMGINYACILKNADMREAAMALSAAVLGFSGSSGIVRLGYCIIVTAWTYTESLNDTKIILEGKKLPLFKTDNMWQISLEDMLGINIKGGDGTPDGFEYKDYLRLLLYISGRERKYYRTMDMIEAGMEELGYNGFRMNDIYGEVSGICAFSAQGVRFTRKYNYKY